MEETTRVFTVKITYIKQVNPANKVDKKTAAERLSKDIKDYLDCDDVVVEQVQDFVMDK